MVDLEQTEVFALVSTIDKDDTVSPTEFCLPMEYVNQSKTISNMMAAMKVCGDTVPIRIITQVPVAFDIPTIKLFIDFCEHSADSERITKLFAEYSDTYDNTYVDPKDKKLETIKEIFAIRALLNVYIYVGQSLFFVVLTMTIVRLQTI